MGCTVVVLAVALSIILWPEGTTAPIEEPAAKITSVTDAPMSSFIGDYSYTGPVDENGKPDGTGSASFDDGRSYKGPFVHGVMQGEDAHFKMANGDTFEGEFRDNRFYIGQYTVSDDGSYFKGSFKNGQPDQGQWYDKNGHRL